MKSSILVTYNRKLKLKLAAAETLVRTYQTNLKIEREQIAQLQGQLKVAVDIGADRNKYKGAWDAVCNALSHVDHYWWFDVSGDAAKRTLQELACRTIHDLQTSDAQNEAKGKASLDRIRFLENAASRQSAAACEVEKKLCALERENADLRKAANGHQKEQSEAWFDVCKALDEVSPGWLGRGAGTGSDVACETIKLLARPNDVRGLELRLSQHKTELDRHLKIFGELHEMLRNAGVYCETSCECITVRLKRFLEGKISVCNASAIVLHSEEHKRLKAQESRWLTVYELLRKLDPTYDQVGNQCGISLDPLLDETLARIKRWQQNALSAASNEMKAVHWQQRWEHLNYDVQTRTLPIGRTTPCSFGL